MPRPCIINDEDDLETRRKILNNMLSMAETSDFGWINADDLSKEQKLTTVAVVCLSISDKRKFSKGKECEARRKTTLHTIVANFEVKRYKIRVTIKGLEEKCIGWSNKINQRKKDIAKSPFPEFKFMLDPLHEGALSLKSIQRGEVFVQPYTQQSSRKKGFICELECKVYRREFDAKIGNWVKRPIGEFQISA